MEDKQTDMTDDTANGRIQRTELSEEDKARIRQLPIKRMKMGSKEVRGFYDREEMLFYLSDENGEPNGCYGKVHIVQHDSPDPAEKDGGPRQGEDGKKPAWSRKGRADKPKEGKRGEDGGEDGKKADTQILFVIAAVVVIFAVILFSVTDLLGGSGGGSAEASVPDPVQAASSPDASPEDTEAPETPEPTAAAEEEEGDAGEPLPEDDPGYEDTQDGIYVMQAVRDIYVGEVCEEGMFRIVSIDVGEYNSLIASGVTPCKWEDANSVMGLYAGQYIQAYQYLSFSDVSVSNPVVSNPWAVYGSGYAVLTIPVSMIEDSGNPVVLGAAGTLHITRTMAYEELADNENENGDGEDEDVYDGEDEDGGAMDGVPGLTTEEGVSQSLTVNYYTVEDVIICDVLNGDGSSTYAFLAPYLSLPQVRMLTTVSSLSRDGDFLESVTPAYVVLRVTAAQAEALGDISGDEISFVLTGDAETDTDSKREVYEGYLQISEILDTAGSGGTGDPEGMEEEHDD